jgi:hypothetical protein
VSRRRSPLLVVVLQAGALAAALGLGTCKASAQVAGDPDASLLRPELDGNPQRPPRFRRGQDTKPQTDTSPIGEIKNFSYQPAVGAGATGFDSTGAKRKNRSSRSKSQNKNQKATPAGLTPQLSSALPSPPKASPPSASNASALAPQPISAPTPPVPPANARPVRKQGGPPTIQPVDGTALAALPVIQTPPRRPLPLDEKPFDPIGVQVGSFVLRPALEVTRGYDTNASRGTPPEHSWFWVVAPELQVNSNWARHELTANLRGSYITYDTAHSLDRPDVNAKVNGRIDVTSLTRIDLEGRLVVATDRPGSPNIQADLARLPIYQTLGATAGIGQRFNRFEVIAKGGVDRTRYQASQFVDGSTEGNDDRDYTQYTTLLRTNYDLLPGVKPFVEIGADARRHDVLPDHFGFYRNSDGINGKVGSTFELSRKLTGEIAVGYLTRRYQDPTLVPVSGALFDASLLWTASALTTAKLTARTSVDETTVAGVSGIFTREVALQVDHAFRRWLLGTVKFSDALDVYVGSPRVDTRYLASAALVYMLSRDWQLKGEYRQEWRTSNEPGNGYSSNVWLLGVRWQR